MDAKPLDKELSYSNGEAAINEEMIVGFFGVLVKWAKPTILLTTHPKTVHRQSLFCKASQA
jgi:hypothetical protein